MNTIGVETRKPAHVLFPDDLETKEVYINMDLGGDTLVVTPPNLTCLEVM